MDLITKSYWQKIISRIYNTQTYKFHLKERHFGTVENIEKAVTDQLKAIPVSDYQRCYEEWEQRLRRCVVSQGNYFEGEKLDL